MSALQIGIRLWRSGELGLLPRAAFELGLARAKLMRILPSDIAELNARPLSRHLNHDQTVEKEVNNITSAVARMARFVPFRSDCLVQALAAQRWLRRVGIRTTIAIQVGRDNDTRFIAHAVLNHAGTCVMGQSAMDLIDIYTPSQVDEELLPGSDV